MTESIKAFPQLDTRCYEPLMDKGMDLRDYFAAKALQAMIATAAAPCLNGLDGYEVITAKQAYVIADAMMGARKK